MKPDPPYPYPPNDPQPCAVTVPPALPIEPIEPPAEPVPEKTMPSSLDDSSLAVATMHVMQHARTRYERMIAEAAALRQRMDDAQTEAISGNFEPMNKLAIEVDGAK